jgi:hypothetical protein
MKAAVARQLVTLIVLAIEIKPVAISSIDGLQATWWALGELTAEFSEAANK